MNEARLLTLITVSLAAGAPPAEAEGAARSAVAVGRLEGYVFDQAGSPLSGVQVRATAEADPQARQVAYSNPDGRFALARLPAGRYTATASAPKLKTVIQKGIVISAGRTAEVSFVMEVHTQTEESGVVEKSPMFSTSRSQVKQTFDLELMQGLPPAISPLTDPAIDPAAAAPFNTESYDHLPENPFRAAADHPLSTFAIDVDTASYSNTRRFLEAGTPPPAGAVRIEELLNYFAYAYPPPPDGSPFAVSFEVGACPWNSEARLVRIGMRGRDIPIDRRPPSNLVFLVDVSGSMQSPDKLPLVKDALRLMVGEMRPQDRIALVVYAGQSGLVLPSTAASQRQTIMDAIDRLEAGGSTNGGAGIALAYAVARKGFLESGNNRVVLASDGDFNVGVTNQSDLVSLIQREARSRVFLTVLGFGTGNLKDSTMEQLADRGNGNYAYIDSLREARKVLVEQLAGTLLTIAKDVKVQVEMNPAQVGAYRLLGYENRLMPREDFNDDRKDGGEIGAGHTVTALYEIMPPGPAAARALAAVGSVDPLRYAPPAGPAGSSPDLMTIKVRYKAPDGDQSRKLEWALRDAPGPAGPATASGASADFRFAAAVAAFGLVLRGSDHRGQADLAMVQRLGREGLGPDRGGHRRQFLELVARAEKLAGAGWSLGAGPGGDGRLVISQAGRRDVSLMVRGRRIDGEVRGSPVHVVVKPVEIAGHMGGEPVWIWMHGREAEGHIGGHDVGFTLIETPTGHLVRGTAVGHTVRLEESRGRLSWLPSCNRPLLRLPARPGADVIYQGTCASGRRMRLTLPDGFEALPPLPRLVLLSLLLTEEDERVAARRRGLFPAEDVR